MLDDFFTKDFWGDIGKGLDIVLNKMFGSSIDVVNFEEFINILYQKRSTTVVGTPMHERESVNPEYVVGNADYDPEMFETYSGVFMTLTSNVKVVRYSENYLIQDPYKPQEEDPWMRTKVTVDHRLRTIQERLPEISIQLIEGGFDVLEDYRHKVMLEDAEKRGIVPWKPPSPDLIG